MILANRPNICILAALLLVAGAGTRASGATISSNLSNVTSGTEAASGNSWLAASFGSSNSAGTLASVTLLLSNPVSGNAQVDLYTDGTLQPGSLVGTLTSPSSYSTSLAATTFSATGITIQESTTYWIVLTALSGEFGWAWTADNTGTGSGFQGTWGSSPDAGATWFTYAVYPTQFSVETAEASVPEPGTPLLVFTALSLFGIVHSSRRLFSKQTQENK